MERVLYTQICERNCCTGIVIIGRKPLHTSVVGAGIGESAKAGSGQSSSAAKTAREALEVAMLLNAVLKFALLRSSALHCLAFRKQA